MSLNYTWNENIENREPVKMPDWQAFKKQNFNSRNFIATHIIFLIIYLIFLSSETLYEKQDINVSKTTFVNNMFNMSLFIDKNQYWLLFYNVSCNYY